jgi:peptidoglycan hydrolase-like protein with peptidoglycan-binding domain
MAFSPVVARDGNNAAQSMAALQDLASVNYPQVGLDSTQQTYRAAALFTPFATAPVTYISIVGSATKTVRIKRIGLWMVATANASIGLSLGRGTALGTGGTAVTPTVGKCDTASAAATAVVKHYTTAAQSAATGSTTGFLTTMNLTGNLVAETVQIFAPAALSIMFPEAGVGGQSLVLRGTSDIIEVQALLGQSGGANGPPAMQMGYVVEWIEDAS